MHFELWCSLLCVCFVCRNIYFYNESKNSNNIQIMAHFDNTDNKIHDISDKLLILDISWFTYRAWPIYISIYSVINAK